MLLPPIAGMNNIVPILTNVRQSLNCFNSLSVSHAVTPSRDNIYSVRFQEHGSENLIANGRYFDSLPKGVNVDHFQKQFPERTTCLHQYINVVLALGQELFLIVEGFTSLLLMPFQKLGSLTA
jgi:hypothetical protein